MARTGMYMSDLGMYDSSQEMVLSGIQPLPELEYARDQVIDSKLRYLDLVKSKSRAHGWGYASLIKLRDRSFSMRKGSLVGFFFRGGALKEGGLKGEGQPKEMKESWGGGITNMLANMKSGSLVRTVI